VIGDWVIGDWVIGDWVDWPKFNQLNQQAGSGHQLNQPQYWEQNPL
jgi:hypothetical protein